MYRNIILLKKVGFLNIEVGYGNRNLEWSARETMELSRAIKTPWIGLQLANTKKTQQVGGQHCCKFVLCPVLNSSGPNPRIFGGEFDLLVQESSNLAVLFFSLGKGSPLSDQVYGNRSSNSYDVQFL